MKRLYALPDYAASQSLLGKHLEDTDVVCNSSFGQHDKRLEIVVYVDVF